MRNPLPLIAAAAALLLSALPAQAWVRQGPHWGVGVYVGPPVIYAPPPPVYYYAPPRPVYVVPPPVYVAPPHRPVYAGPAGQACYAGAWVCPLDRPAGIGASCSCPTNGGRAFGQAR